MSQRIFNTEADWQYVHVVFKAVDRGHGADRWMFCHRKRLFFIKQLMRFLRLYEIKLICFCAVSSHAHCVFAIPKTHHVSLKETADRYKRCYGKRMDARSKSCHTLRKNLNNLSKFVQQFERDFAYRFNKASLFRRRKSLWVPRYHHSLLCNDKALVNCWKYVLFNGVKAGLAPRPHEDDCCSWGCEDWLKQECLRNFYRHFCRIHAWFNGSSMSFDSFVKFLEDQLLLEQAKYTKLTPEEQQEMKDFWAHELIGSAEDIDAILGPGRTRKLSKSKQNPDLMAC